MKCQILRHFIWVNTVCKRWQLVKLPKLLLATGGPSSIIMACQDLASLTVSRHYSKRRQLKWVCQPVCRNVCLPERPPVCTLWAQLLLLQFIPFSKLCICFAHELVCMWFGHSAFFHLMDISLFWDLRCRESKPPPILFNFWCIPVLLFIGIPRHLKVWDIMVYAPFRNLRWVSVRLTVRLSPFRFHSQFWVFCNRFYSNFL